MKKWLGTLRTISQLGISEVLYVVWYRFSLKFGIRELFFPIEKFDLGEDLFANSATEATPYLFDKSLLLAEAEDLKKGGVLYYSKHKKNIGTPVNWFLNPFNGREYPKPEDHWTKISDFNPDFGDIKNLWEVSRFGWMPTLARASRITGDSSFPEILNNYAREWLIQNPLNQGPNWKCGQEASIRVFNLLTTSLISDQTALENEALASIVSDHLKRIQGNIRYAFAQNNNHGTSEAAALFIGGIWLNSIAPGQYPQARKYALRGRFWLEKRINKLIAEDGGFSQYSINYHRVFLDTMILVEFWRQKLDQLKFSPHFYFKVEKAIDWLCCFTDAKSGHAPNLGANDGAMLLNLHNCDYRDFRPVLQTANVIFRGNCLFGPGSWNEPLFWLGIKVPDLSEHGLGSNNRVFKSGYVKISGESSWALIRTPIFRFRPSHNDVFHFDLWYRGENVLSDSGTYSYANDRGEPPLNLKSVHSHNTISFNGDEQMPQISRFLLSEWLQADEISEVSQAEGTLLWIGRYKTPSGYTHQRSIKVVENVWWIDDELEGSFQSATIGFNFSDPNYIHKEQNILNTKAVQITVNSECIIQVKKSNRSLYYLELEEINRMEVIVRKPGRYTTIIELK